MMSARGTITSSAVLRAASARCRAPRAPARSPVAAASAVAGSSGASISSSMRSRRLSPRASAAAPQAPEQPWRCSARVAVRQRSCAAPPPGVGQAASRCRCAGLRRAPSRRPRRPVVMADQVQRAVRRRDARNNAPRRPALPRAASRRTTPSASAISPRWLATRRREAQHVGRLVLAAMLARSARFSSRSSASRTLTLRRPPSRSAAATDAGPGPRPRGTRRRQAGSAYHDLDASPVRGRVVPPCRKAGE